jgi:GTP-binding protein
MPFTVAIVGRPNVGKSTLFNRLAGKRLAIVDDTPGVTRDRREGEGRLGDLTFTVVDTAGLDEGARGLEARLRQQTERALATADVALFLIDARAGVTPIDHHFAGWLRAKKVPIILVANKCEGGAAGALEAFELGLGEPIAISAEHGEGLSDLYDALAPFAPRQIEDVEEALAEQDAGVPPDNADEEADHPLQLAVIGRPNVGKSTLVNRLIGEERMVTGPEAGITRDAIAIPWVYAGRAIKLFDTAGLRRKAKVTEKLEGLATADTLRAIRFAHVVILVLDAEQLLEKQDLTIARLVVEEGRALVIAVNKWDVIEDRAAGLRRLKDRLERSLTQVEGIPVVPCSALTGEGGDGRLVAAGQADAGW